MRKMYGVMSLNDGTKEIGCVSDWLKDFSEKKGTSKTVDVPCGDCHACCTRGYEILLVPGDDKTLKTDTIGSNRFLKRKNDGSCYYLRAGKCKIYDRRPRDCRRYDCRPMAYCFIRPYGKKEICEALDAWRMRSAIRTELDYKILYLMHLTAAVLIEDCNATAEDAAISAAILVDTILLTALEKVITRPRQEVEALIRTHPLVIRFMSLVGRENSHAMD